MHAFSFLEGLIFGGLAGEAEQVTLGAATRSIASRSSKTVALCENLTSRTVSLGEKAPSAATFAVNAGSSGIDSATPSLAGSLSSKAICSASPAELTKDGLLNINFEFGRAGISSPVQFFAEPVVVGSELQLRMATIDIPGVSENALAGKVGTLAISRARQILCEWAESTASENGYETVRLLGRRGFDSSSGNPGHEVDILLFGIGQ